MKLKSALLAMALVTSPTFAQEADSSLSETEIASRSEAIQKTLRCVVCQNQSIADSNSTLAEDMRNLVERRVRMGETEEEVRDYMQARYGDFVLMKPPIKAATWALWFSPLVLFILGGIWYAFNVRSRSQTAEAETEALSDTETARLKAILAGKDTSE